MIDVIIPTMWMTTNFIDVLKDYVSHPLIKRVIIIDNNKKSRPKNDILNHEKIELVCYNKNIYVNPAWNEGYYRSTSDVIAFINDDIHVQKSVFDMVTQFNFKDGQLIGVDLRGYTDNYKIDDYIDTEEKIVKLNYDALKPIGGQAWAFGICMFMHRKTYRIIPSLYQVWYGDDYLVQRAKEIYVIRSNKIKGSISETLTKFDDPNSDVSKRIELDSKNLIAYNHFKNGKSWDIPHNMIRGYEQKRRLMKNNYFESEYEKAKTQKSDINENVHILYDLAKECKHVTEMGVRTGVSTRALLNSNVKLISYDIELNESVNNLFRLAKTQGKDVQYIKANVLNIEIEETDLLFIDTYHVYDQLKKELELHGNKAKKYLAFHDTNTFGLVGEDGRDRKGLLSAIIEFIMQNPHWRFKIYKTNNNGFTVLERVS